VLWRDWDPIGINDVPEANDEYDAYVGGVYRLLASRCSADQSIDHLFVIELRRWACWWQGANISDLSQRNCST
jgi:hypothetical protein